MRKKFSYPLVLGFLIKSGMSVAAASGAALVVTPDSADVEIDAIVKLSPLLNDSGDDIAITSVASANGAIAKIYGEQVLYRYPADKPIIPTDSVNYTITDAMGNTTTSTISIHLMKDGKYVDASPNVKFSINDDDITVPFGKATIIDALSNDTSPDGGLVISQAASTSGARVEIKDNKINYIAGNHSISSDHVIYYVHDAAGKFGWATINISIDGDYANVRAENDTLSAVFNGVTPEMEDMSFVLENDTFDSKNTIISNMMAKNGSVFKSKAGLWTYAPQQAGNDTVTYTLENIQSGESATASVNVNVFNSAEEADTINAVNDTYTLRMNDGLTPDINLLQAVKNDDVTRTTKAINFSATKGKVYSHNGIPYYRAIGAGTDTITYDLQDSASKNTVPGTIYINILQ